MLIPLALFLGLLAATAFIAHWSDNLGKKLGKKRVSVFGLRPRTSATILTVVSSWGIMALTLVALLLAVKPLRVALFSYEKQREKFLEQRAEFAIDRTHFQSEETHFNRDRANFVAERANFSTDRARFASDLTSAQQKTKATQNSFQTATDNLKQAQDAKEVALRGAMLAQKTQQLAQQNERVAKQGEQTALSTARNAQAQRAAALSGLRVATTDLKEKQDTLRATQIQLEKRKDELSRTQHQVSVVKQQLDVSQKEIKVASQKVLSSYKKVLTSYRQVLQAKKEETEAQKRVLKLEKTAEDLQNAVGELQGLATQGTGYALQLAFSDIRLHFDQTLAERRIDATPSPEQIQSELRVLINSSQNAAQQLVPDAKVAIEPLYTPDAKTGERVALSEEQTLDYYARLLSASNQGVSARLVSASNYPEGQKRILARFVFVPVRTIYNAGKSIGESTIDATKSEAAIFGQLQDLVETARLNAVKNGSNPPLSPEDRNFFDGDTGQKMFDTLRQLQRLGRSVPVRVVAARDLDATEPLQIRFQIGSQGAARNTT